MSLSPTTTNATGLEHSYRAWLIDLDGTLYQQSYVRWAMAAQVALLGLSKSRILRAFRHEHERLRAELSETVDSPFQLQLERTAAHLKCPVAHVENVVRDWMIVRPGMWLRLFRRRALLAEIAQHRARGGLTAIVSDYPATQKLQALGAADLFDVIIANGEAGGPGRLKPWPDGFLAAARQLGVTPAECLVLGDRPDADGLAAERAKMAFRRIPDVRQRNR